MGNLKGSKHKGGPLTKAIKEKLDKRIVELIESRKINYIKQEDLAKEFKTTRQAVSKAIDDVYASIPPEQIDKVMVDFKAIFKKLEKEIEITFQMAQNVKERADVIRLYFQMMKEKTDMLERFFIKQRAVDNVAIKGEIDHKFEIEVVRVVQNAKD